MFTSFLFGEIYIIQCDFIEICNADDLFGIGIIWFITCIGILERYKGSHDPLDKCNLGYIYPKSVELWSDKNKKTPFEYKSKSGKKVWFKCGCGKHADTFRTISNAILNNFDCPQCVKERNESKIEETVRLYLTDELHYLTNHEFNCTIVPINPYTNHPLPFDNEIPELKLIIEVHGSQHYQMTDYFHSKDSRISIEEAFEYQKWKDNFKKNYALEQGYNYIEIPYWKVKDDSYKELISNKIKEILQEVA